MASGNRSGMGFPSRSTERDGPVNSGIPRSGGTGRGFPASPPRRPPVDLRRHLGSRRQDGVRCRAGPREAVGEEDLERLRRGIAVDVTAVVDVGRTVMFAEAPWVGSWGTGLPVMVLSPGPLPDLVGATGGAVVRRRPAAVARTPEGAASTASGIDRTACRSGTSAPTTGPAPTTPANRRSPRTTPTHPRSRRDDRCTTPVPTRANPTRRQPSWSHHQLIWGWAGGVRSVGSQLTGVSRVTRVGAARWW